MAGIREVDAERDAPAIVDLVREIAPTAVLNVASFVHRFRTTPERSGARMWVAEVDGEVVGRADCFRSLFAAASGNAVLHVAVRVAHRGHGLGAALYDVALEHGRTLDVDQLSVIFHENSGGVAFAERRGFAHVRSETEASLDPRAVAERADGDVRPVAAIDPRLAYVVDIEATHDMPSTESFEGMTYEEWTEHVLDHPLFTPKGSFVAFADGEAAAVSLLTVDHETGRAANFFTGTRAAFRGRGLARAAKLASIEWAAANGVSRVFTYNDATNAPMLALNARLGYVADGRRVEMLKALAGMASSPPPPAPAP